MVLKSLIKKSEQANSSIQEQPAAKKDEGLLMMELESYNQQLVKKQYVEIVRENGVEDKLKKHSEIAKEVFSTNEEQLDNQIGILRKHFRSRTFNSMHATEILRDDYLDKYFKDTYIEWGTRWYLEKL